MSVTRLDYRETKTPKSVCVYTVAQESRYLIIENLSTAGSIIDFVRHCQKFGHVEKYHCLDTHSSSDQYFDVVLLTFDAVSSARYAKRKLDNKPYDHHLIRANYAPEYETAEDIRAKFQDRLISVTKRLNFTYYYRDKKDKKEKSRDIYGPLEKREDNTVITTKTIPTATSRVEQQHKKRRRI